ncbi:MAG: hypothetical protein Q4Q03_04430 [Bowdeniella nasicola]|nr:hypothetical protein [Bowdeniella nasicola]
MNILEEKSGGSTTPNVVGTPNATKDVYHHRKPGRRRANFFRYFRFNLPRLTKALIMVVIATIGACAGAVAASGHLPFAGAEIALWIVVIFAVIFVALSAFTRRDLWDYGTVVAAAATIVYFGGIFGYPPYVHNGASIYLAATWNLMLFASLGYFVLNWAINLGILVVWPHTQGFTD